MRGKFAILTIALLTLVAAMSLLLASHRYIIAGAVLAVYLACSPLAGWWLTASPDRVHRRSGRKRSEAAK